MIQIIKNSISLNDIKTLAAKTFGDLVKAVVDIDMKIIAIGGELHADEEHALISNGSKQDSLWGINIYPKLSYPDRIEFDSMINVRPSQGNMTRGVDSKKVKERIISIVQKLIVD